MLSKSPPIHLMLFCLNVFVNGLMWCSFAPISIAAGLVFDINQVAVNMLSLSYLILYPLGSWLASELLDRRGLRVNMVVGSCLDLAGGIFRSLAIVLLNSAKCDPHIAFGVLLFGQCLSALAQPLFTNTVVKTTTTWFVHHDGPTVVASMMSPLGNAVGQVLPILVVDQAGNGIDILMHIQVGLAAFSCLMVVCLFSDGPDHAVSDVSGLREKQLQKLVGGTEKPHALQNAIMMMKDVQFLKLFFSFGIGLGIFNAITTLTAQLLSPLHYSDDDAGVAGGIFIGTGLVLSGVVGFIMDKTGAYVKMFRIGVVCASIMIIVFLLLLKPDAVVQVYVGFALLGGTCVPLLPLVFECSAACTYPLPEDISNGLLMLSGQLFGIIDILVLPVLIEASGDDYKSGNVFFTPVNIFMLFNAICVFGVAITFNAVDKRHDFEVLGKLHDQSDDLLDGDSKPNITPNLSHGTLTRLLTINKDTIV